MPTPEPLRRLIDVTQITDADIRKVMRDAAAEADKIVQSLEGATGSGARIRSAQISLAKLQVQTWGEVGQAVRVGIANAVDSSAELSAMLDQRLFAQIGVNQDLWTRAILATSRAGIDSYISRQQMGYTLSDRVYRNAALSRGYVERAVNNGLLLGKTAKEIAKDVVGFIDPATPGGASYAAMRLGRTEVQNAYHQTSREHYQTSPWVERVKWSVSGSHPREDECDDLAEATGVPGWGPGEYRPEDVPDKPHPQCLCWIEPVAIPLDKFAENFHAGKYDDYIDAQMGRAPAVPAGPGATVDYKMAKATYAQVRKDTNYRMTPAQNRAEAARRLGISTDELDDILKSKGKVTKTPAPKPLTPTPDVDYQKVKATYAQVRKDTNYKLSPASNRAETARRLGITSDDVDRILKTKGKATVKVEVQQIKYVTEPAKDLSYISNNLRSVGKNQTAVYVDGVRIGRVQKATEGYYEMSGSVRTGRFIVEKRGYVAIDDTGSGVIFIKNGPYQKLFYSSDEARAALIRERAVDKTVDLVKFPLKKPFNPSHMGVREEWQDDMFMVNPHRYDVSDEVRAWYKNNCTSCSMSYELRRRGYDVVARGGIVHGQNMKRVMRSFVGGSDRYDDIARRSWNVRDEASALRELRRLPVGSRGFVDVEWKHGGAHIWNWEKIGPDKYRFIDAQSSQTWVGFNNSSFHAARPGWNFVQTNDLKISSHRRAAGDFGSHDIDTLEDLVDVTGWTPHNTWVDPYGYKIGVRGGARPR